MVFSLLRKSSHPPMHFHVPAEKHRKISVMSGRSSSRSGMRTLVETIQCKSRQSASQPVWSSPSPHMSLTPLIDLRHLKPFLDPFFLSVHGSHPDAIKSQKSNHSEPGQFWPHERVPVCWKSAGSEKFSCKLSCSGVAPASVASHEQRGAHRDVALP